MRKTEKEIIEAYKKIIEGGSRGGKNTLEKHGRDHFAKMGEKSAEAKKKRAK